jgi:hypothetical protein
MMKKLFNTILVLATTVLIVACDEISLDKRLTYVEPPEVSRAVLIEDYTGQYCVNCPRATEEIERLIEQYGDTTVIAVAIHSGPFGKSKGEPSPLYTEVGDMYFNTWGLSSQPVGLIDRLFDSSPFSYTDWAAGVNYEVAFKPPVGFVTDIYYDRETREADIEVQTIGLDSALVKGKLQVWLVEDSIDSFQLMPDGSRQEHYNHMHVFRASVNDPWGDELSVSRGQVAVMDYDLKLDPAWVPEHCSIITFLYDESGVQQVAKKKLTD